MADKGRNWWDNSPDTLQSTCLAFCIRRLSIFGRVEERLPGIEFKRSADLNLPSPIVDQLLDRFLRIIASRLKEFDASVITQALSMVLSIFADPEKTRLSRVDLSGLSRFYNEDTLLTVTAHDLTEFKTSNSPATEIECLLANHKKRGMECLHFEEYICDADLKPRDYYPRVNVKHGWHSEEWDKIAFPKLRKLRLGRDKFGNNHIPHFFDRELLHVLHLSNAKLDVTHLKSFATMTSLISLTLCEVDLMPLGIETIIPMIGQMKTLRHLDLSFSLSRYEFDVEAMRNLVRNLPRLASLDISGNCIVGSTQAQVQSAPRDYTFPELDGRMFDFLGLWECSYRVGENIEDACSLDNIPAIKVAGEANEDQFLVALLANSNKSHLLSSVLFGLQAFLRDHGCDAVSNRSSILVAVLDSMEKYLHIAVLVKSACSIVYLIIKQDHEMPMKLKRRIITTMVNVVADREPPNQSNHWSMGDSFANTAQDALLTLCQFNIPKDVMFLYDRLVKTLVTHATIIFTSYAQMLLDQGLLIERIVVYMINSLACSVGHRQKLLLGSIGVIQTLLEIIKYKLTHYDPIVETAWSSLWNATDETEENCRLFVESGGLELFLLCSVNFPQNENLLRNMMGLMGNIAEVRKLRIKLMHPKYVNVFRELLRWTSDNIEVSYNACSILAHMTADGPESWTIEEPSRQDVLDEIKMALYRWDLDTARSINYRSFKPIVRLLTCFHTLEAQHWATWALCNLTRLYPSRYCQIVERDGCLPLLEGILADPRPYKEVKDLVQQVKDKCLGNAVNDDLQDEVNEAEREEDVDEFAAFLENIEPLV